MPPIRLNPNPMRPRCSCTPGFVMMKSTCSRNDKLVKSKPRTPCAAELDDVRGRGRFQPLPLGSRARVGPRGGGDVTTAARASLRPSGTEA